MRNRIPGTTSRASIESLYSMKPKPFMSLTSVISPVPWVEKWFSISALVTTGPSESSQSVSGCFSREQVDVTQDGSPGNLVSSPPLFEGSRGTIVIFRTEECEAIQVRKHTIRRQVAQIKARRRHRVPRFCHVWNPRKQIHQKSVQPLSSTLIEPGRVVEKPQTF